MSTLVSALAQARGKIAGVAYTNFDTERLERIGAAGAELTANQARAPRLCRTRRPAAFDAASAAALGRGARPETPCRNPTRFQLRVGPPRWTAALDCRVGLPRWTVA